MEKWAEIQDYKSIYLISNLGRVKSIKRETKFNTGIGIRAERILKQSKSRFYPMVYLYYENGERKSVTVHSLVAKSFVPNPKNLTEIDHIDGNPENNNAENLRWVTHKENCNNPISLQRYKGRKSAKAKPVYCYSLNGDFIGKFDNITIAAEKTKTHRENISKCCKGKYKKTNGLIFKYAV